MPDSTTPNFHWTLPTVGAAAATWGASLNANWTDLDNRLNNGLTAITAMTGVVSSASNLTLNSGNTPATNNIYGKRNNSVRWAIVMPDGETESGGNAGSNLLISRYDDGGNFIATPLEIVRSSGQVVINGGASITGPVSVTGGITSSAAVQGATVASTGGLTVAGASTVSGVANFNSGVQFPNFRPDGAGHSYQLGWDGSVVHLKVDNNDLGGIVTSSTAGAYLPISGGTITGNLGVNGTLSVATNIGATGQINSGANIIAANQVQGTTLYSTQDATIARNLGVGNNINAATIGATTQIVCPIYYMQPGGVTWSMQGTTSPPGFGSSAIMFYGPSGLAANIENNGDLGIQGQGFKPGGGSWANSSDARIKTVERKYELGLDEVLKLDPIVYRFKDNDSPPEESRPRIGDRKFVGLVAQEVEGIFPDMVTKRKGWIDGVEVADQRMLDASELVFALVNAVKTLTARLEALEAK